MQETTAISAPTAVELAQSLIRLDTTNPPGNEAACIGFLDELLRGAGLDVAVSGASPDRPNLLARLRGRGEAPPFLMYGHVDVVPTAGQTWRRDPFGGEVVDGMLWGRGALDMKGGLAMMAVALLQLARDGDRPAGDVLFLALSDEECGSAFGARHVVERRPDWLENVRYAIGEFGGLSTTINGRRVYPIAVSEKQWCELVVRVRGRGGHGSAPVRGGAMAKLAEVLRRLDDERLPVRVPPVTRQMLEGIAATLPEPGRQVLSALVQPESTDRVLDRAGPQVAGFDPMLHNTVCATKVRAAERSDVVPEAAELELDGRVLPGSSPDELLDEVRALLGAEAEVWLRTAHDTVPEASDLGLFDELARAVRAVDEDAVCVPMILPGLTDGRFLSRLGIQTYGFLPLRLPAGFEPARLVHGPDERVPVAALEFGADVIGRLLRGGLGG